MFAGLIRKIQLEVMKNLLRIIFHSITTWVQIRV